MITTKAVLDNGTYFLELDHCVAVIKSFKDAEQIKDDKSTIIHVLMDGMIGDGNLIQQIYMKDKKKFGAIVDALIIAANNYTQLQDLKLILGSSSEELKVEDVKLMYDTVNFAGLQVKASGGIRDKEAAIAMIKAGAARLGTSSGIKIVS